PGRGGHEGDRGRAVEEPVRDLGPVEADVAQLIPYLYPEKRVRPPDDEGDLVEERATGRHVECNRGWPAGEGPGDRGPDGAGAPPAPIVCLGRPIHLVIRAQTEAGVGQGPRRPREGRPVLK